MQRESDELFSFMKEVIRSIIHTEALFQISKLTPKFLLFIYALRAFIRDYSTTRNLDLDGTLVAYSSHIIIF